MGSSYFSKRIPERTAVRRPRSRPKTYSSAEKADAVAKEQGIKEYTITELSTFKFRIDQKQ